MNFQAFSALMDEDEELFNQVDSLPNFAQDPNTCLKLAIKLADLEYNHPECVTVQAAVDRRSFCFHHQKVTAKACLLIHGFTACPYEMRELGELLYHKGYNVYGVRLAGHGTVVTDFKKYGAADWKKSVRKGMAIAALLGEEVIVIGESMGGSLATWLGAEFPEFVSKIILCAPCFQIANPYAGLTLSRWVRGLLPDNDMGVTYEWQFDYWYRVIPTSGVAELVKIAAETRRLGPKISVPVTIIQAANDQVVRPKGAVRFFDTLSQLDDAQKKLILFKEGHHNLTIDLNPQKVRVFDWILGEI